MSGVFCCSSSLYFETGSLSEPNSPARLGWLASISVSLRLGLEACSHRVQFYMNVGDLNLGPCGWAANTFHLSHVPSLPERYFNTYTINMIL